MRVETRPRRGSALLPSLIAGLFVLSPAPPAAGGADAGDGDTSGNGVTVGGQLVDVATEGGPRDDKFQRNSDVPEAVVVEDLVYSVSEKDRFLQIRAWDLSQRDEGLRLRAGAGDRVRLRASYQSLPFRAGSGAKFVLGRTGDDAWGPVFRIADATQRTLQNPDGDGTPFYSGASETASDNAAVQGLARDLLGGFEPIGLSSRRRQGSGGATIHATNRLAFDVDAKRETRRGTQALGTGTYQRITDVNGDGTGDSDSYFSVRGIEIVMPIDYTTTRYQASARYRDRRWFVNVTGGLSEFDNAHVGLTYDNPFWADDVLGSSGSRRGLWEEGRASYEPSNEAWDVTASGSVDLPSRTRVTAVVSVGEHSQNERFLPITSNPALIGTKDINGDGVVDAADDPTVAAIPGLPPTIDGVPVLGTSLDASSDVLSYNLQVTSKPARGLSVTGRLRHYDYSGQEGILAVPARAEYVESALKTDFKGDQILHVPLDWSRRTTDVEASYRLVRGLKVKAFGGRKTYEYDRYRNTDDKVSRETGSRAVEGTDDDFLGLTAMFGWKRWLTGRATWSTADRSFRGDYTIGFDGELDTVRQFDLANRERMSGDVHMSVMPTDRVTLGVGYRLVDDDYPDSEYGVQAGKTTGWNASASFAATEMLDLFAWADMSEWDVDMHLRSKCANCPAPAGAAPWDIPNFDWFTDYTDETTSLGGGASWRAGGTRVDLSTSYVKGEIEQKSANPATPVELNTSNTPLAGTVVTAALALDFPTQETQFVSTELRLTRRLTDLLDAGLWWRYDDFNVVDFQWDGMTPYGAEFLTVDETTRYLLLDSRYVDYTAHVGGLFMRARF